MVAGYQKNNQPKHGDVFPPNYTSVDPKQFTVSKFRLKPVILISEYFCSRCGHNGRQPETLGDNGRQRETRPLQSPRRRPHQPPPTPHIKGDNRRQWETTGDKTTSEPKKPTTPTNTKAARSKVALRTPTVNCLGKKQASEVTGKRHGNHWNQMESMYIYVSTNLWAKKSGSSNKTCFFFLLKGQISLEKTQHTTSLKFRDEAVC